MKGRLLTYRAQGALADPPDVEDFSDDVADLVRLGELLAKLRAIVDDDIELVPWLASIKIDGRIEPCVAFVGEHGKYRNLPVNRRGTLLWDAAVQRLGTDAITLRDSDGTWSDWIVGPMVVLIGDDEFMASL